MLLQFKAQPCGRIRFTLIRLQPKAIFPGGGAISIAARRRSDMLAARFNTGLAKYFMSQHRSLRAASTLGGKRNVLKRFERTALLEKRGQRKAGDKITGLRKTKPDA